ncbi:hypothetical protein VZT92_014745 [Zoarces viviparus]|uniref:Uncharacterized protein n=3 Tax=Zoarces viviparus TaxID=48416 RepID=A0AAW1F271_ZOAVI
MLKGRKKRKMEAFKDFCQAGVDAQLEVSSKLKETLLKAEQELKNGHLQWQEEKSSLKALHQQNCDHFHSQMQVIASERAKEQEAAKQILERAEAFYNAQMNLAKATVDEQLNISSKLKEALHKAEQELENGHRQWQEEKSSLKALQQQNCDHFHSQMQVIASERAQEQEAAKQTLETAEAFYNAQMNLAKARVDEQLEVSSKLKEDLHKAEQELGTGHLQWQQEHFNKVQVMASERAQEQEAAKQTLETAEAFHKAQMDLSKATVDEQLEISSKLNEALHKAKQELETDHLQWQQEHFNVTARQLKYCEYLQSQMQVMASERAQEQEAAKQTLETAEAFYKAQMDEQRAETNRIAAALKETQDLLETERHVQHNTTTEKEMEVFKNFCRARVGELLDENSKLKAAFNKAENELQGFQAAHKAQLEEQRAETSKILAVLKKTEAELDAESLNILELASRNADLEKTCRDLNHAQLENIATLQTIQEEATQMVKRNRASQAQLKQLRTENNRIKAAWKMTEDLLETERLLWQ